MPLEKPAYRDNLERLDEAFPNKEALNFKEIAKFLGKDERAIRRVLRPLYRKGIGILKATLARELS